MDVIDDFEDAAKLWCNWGTQRDAEEIAEIERSCVLPLRQDVIESLLDRSDCSCRLLASRHSGAAYGYVLYIVDDVRTHIVRVGVRPEYRRRGVGRTLVSRIIERSRHFRRNIVTAHVPGLAFDACHLFASIGFASRVAHDMFGSQDGIVFSLQLKDDKCSC